MQAGVFPELLSCYLIDELLAADYANYANLKEHFYAWPCLLEI
jgi:hypothetical protein